MTIQELEFENPYFSQYVYEHSPEDCCPPLSNATHYCSVCELSHKAWCPALKSIEFLENGSVRITYRTWATTQRPSYWGPDILAGSD